MYVLVFSSRDLRHAVLLHRDHHRAQPHLRSHHRHLRGPQVGEAAEGRDHQELMFHLW